MTVRRPADHDPAMEIRFRLPLPAPPLLLPTAPRRLLAILAAIVLVGWFAAATPTTGDGSTQTKRGQPVRPDPRGPRRRLAGGHQRADLGNGALGAPIAEHVAYRYPGTSWPGGHSNMYLYGHARVGTFLNL